MTLYSSNNGTERTREQLLLPGVGSSIAQQLEALFGCLHGLVRDLQDAHAAAPLRRNATIKRREQLQIMELDLKIWAAFVHAKREALALTAALTSPEVRQ